MRSMCEEFFCLINQKTLELAGWGKFSPLSKMAPLGQGGSGGNSLGFLSEFCVLPQR